VSIAFAFLHHVAAFGLVAALATELVLLKDGVAPQVVRRLRALDAVYGASAGVLLVVGLLRVFYFEKGAAYYFHSAPFIAKLSLFVAVGLISIYPTLAFRRWAALPQGASAGNLRRVRRLIHLQLAGVVLILLCAAMMARGVGYFG
jgi:putative membrane protein